MAIFGHVRQKEWENERMNNFSTSEEGQIDFAKKYLSCSNCSNNQNGYSYQLLTNTCLADSNDSSIKAIFGSAVTRSIATTASKVKFCQKEKCLRHRGDKMYRLSISRRHAWTTLERLAQDTKRWAVTADKHPRFNKRPHTNKHPSPRFLSSLPLPPPSPHSISAAILNKCPGTHSTHPPILSQLQF